MCQSTHCTHNLVNQSRHPLQRVFFGISVVLTVLAFIIALTLSVFKTETLNAARETAVEQYRIENPQSNLDEKGILAQLGEDEREFIDFLENVETWQVMLAPLGFLLLIIYQVGKIYGGLRADGIRVTPEQFGDVHKMWTEMAQELGMKKVPDLYIQNGNGALNVFATCLPGYRAFGAIYSDILERALANDDPKVLRFILGHELGHIRLNHVNWWVHVLSVVGKLPIINYFVGLPLSRAQEYGCDKIGYALSQDNECRGLLMLAAGKHLYRQVDIATYEKEQIGKRSYWATFHNAQIDHPIISWRIAALRENKHGAIFWK